MIVSNSTVLVWSLIVCLVPQQLKGVELYKWQDADGVTHYSEDPPPSPVTEFKSLEFPDFSASGARASTGDRAEEDYFSVINQAKRMEASRLERERLRLEKEKLRQQQRSQQTIVIPDYTYEHRGYSLGYSSYGDYYSGYSYRHKYHRYKHHYAPHYKNYSLSTRHVGRARQRVYGSISGRHYGHRSRSARSRSIRLR